MPTCPRCSTPAADGASFCARCGVRLSDDRAAGAASTPPSIQQLAEAETIEPDRDPHPAAPTMSVRVAPPTRAAARELLPGMVVAGRYRIVARVGRGGMGEVYRADDLTLGQTVALKFIAPELAGSPARRDRFVSEVRVARQITHPCVCRVHDIGFHQPPGEPAQPYLSMEFVDGEDLASLLRRIGRLPADKAAQVGAQICAGLSAAHAQGVLHRDLKPANIMLDGRGQVRITDFGLAEFAASADDEHAPRGRIAGTPAYMSPEQLAGRPATIRSDLFALGLVLYELFTGERAVQAESIDGIAEQLGSRDFPTPGTRVKDLDPAIEAMIMRCLEPRPEDRPPSASAVAAALPGGDAVAGVIASGQTPDPSLLAASGASGRVTMVAAAIWLIICAACVLLVAQLNRSASLLGVMGRTKSPEVLAERARETLRGLGLDIGDDSQPGWSVWGVHTNIAMLDHIENSRPSIAPPRWWGALRSPPLESTLSAAQPPAEPLPPPAMEFWFRWSPRLISPELGKVIITATDPPPGPGDACVRMDLQGRLIGLDAEPGARPIDAPSERPAPWPALLQAAGLRDAWLTPAATTTDAASRGDARAAWTMNLSQPPLAGATAHVEAAALRGRPILFRVVWPWGAAVEAPATDPFYQRIAMFGFVVPLIIAPVVAGAVMARRNWRAGRGDRRGALRVAAGIVILETAAWLLMADHSAALEEYDRVAAAIGGALLEGVLVWMIYLALEPAVRRRRPAAILAWTRLTSGRVVDAMVARDVLRGAALGAAWCVLYKAWVIVAHNFTDAPAPTIVPDEALRGVPAAIAMILSGLSGSVQYGLLMLMGLLLWSRTGKWKWPARAGFGVFVFLLGFIILALLGQPQAANSVFYLQPWGLVTAIVYFFVLARLGLLTAVVMTTTMWTLCVLPATLESGRWYAPIGWTGVAAVIAAAAWGAWGAARVQARVAGGAAISDAGMTSRSAG